MIICLVSRAELVTHYLKKRPGTHEEICNAVASVYSNGSADPSSKRPKAIFLYKSILWMEAPNILKTVEHRISMTWIFKDTSIIYGPQIQWGFMGAR